MSMFRRQFAITAEGFEFPDYVYAEDVDAAILEWARSVVDVTVIEIEEEEPQEYLCYDV